MKQNQQTTTDTEGKTAATNAANQVFELRNWSLLHPIFSLRGSCLKKKLSPLGTWSLCEERTGTRGRWLLGLVDLSLDGHDGPNMKDG